MSRPKRIGQHYTRHVQRWFLTWLDQNQSRFLLTPHSMRRTSSHLDLSLGAVTDRIEIVLHNDGITVAVMWQGECFDRLQDFDIDPQHSPRGHFSTLVMPEYQEYYSTKDALWCNEVFEPFLAWTNERLAPANWLAFLDHEGATEAILLRDFSEYATCDTRLMAMLSDLRKVDGTPSLSSDTTLRRWLIPLHAR